MSLWLRSLIAPALIVISACSDRGEVAPQPSSKQLGDNLCNIAPPASDIRDNSIGAQIGLDLSKIARVGASGNVSATVNDKVTSLFQAIPQRDVVCQMLLQTISCAAAMKNDAVVTAMTKQVEASCHAEKPLNSPQRSQILERVNVLSMEIPAHIKQIERLAPKTEAAGKEWQNIKALAELASDPEEKARLTSQAEKLEQIYWAAYRTEEWFRNEKHKRDLELASLRAKTE